MNIEPRNEFGAGNEAHMRFRETNPPFFSRKTALIHQDSSWL